MSDGREEREERRLRIEQEKREEPEDRAVSEDGDDWEGEQDDS